MLKLIILPRQARDKHIGLENTPLFSSGQTYRFRKEWRVLTAGQGLHGSGDPIYSNISWWNYTYEHGRLHTGQINVAWQLQDVTADDGGFVVGEYMYYAFPIIR